MKSKIYNVLTVIAVIAIVISFIGILFGTTVYGGDKLMLQGLPVDSSGAANGGSVDDARGGRFNLKVSTLAATADSCSMTFRLGPIITEGVTAILGWLRLSHYSDTGSVATDTLTCRLFTSYDPSLSTLTLTAIDSNKFTDTGTWFLNVDDDTMFKKFTFIDVEAITPDNLETDSSDYGVTIDYRVHGEIIKQKLE